MASLTIDVPQTGGGATAPRRIGLRVGLSGGGRSWMIRPSEEEFGDLHLTVTLPNAHAYFRDHAEVWHGRPVPAAWRRRRNRSPHGCYAAAGKWMGEDGVTYVEGFALSAAWVPHAWLIDGAGVIDLAWETPGERYIGCRLPAKGVAEAIRHTGVFGPVLELVAGGAA